MFGGNLLRHTDIVYLLGRGIRAAEIGCVAGDIPRDDFVTYMQFGESISRLPLEEIDRVHPALRSLTGLQA